MLLLLVISYYLISKFLDNECILYFKGLLLVQIRRKKCVQFTDDRNTKYALKVVNGTKVIFEVSLKIICDLETFLSLYYFFQTQKDVYTSNMSGMFIVSLMTNHTGDQNTRVNHKTKNYHLQFLTC